MKEYSASVSFSLILVIMPPLCSLPLMIISTRLSMFCYCCYIHCCFLHALLQNTLYKPIKILNFYHNEFIMKNMLSLNSSLISLVRSWNLAIAKSFYCSDFPFLLIINISNMTNISSCLHWRYYLGFLRHKIMFHIEEYVKL